MRSTCTPSWSETIWATVTSGVTGATALALGNVHTCALVGGGAVSCWGANASGQLGDNTTTDRELPGLGARSQRIAVCGLNPHAGEGGYLGREEIDVIAPAIADVSRDGAAEFTGPVSADTVFVPEHARRYDAVIAMYHDQGLPVLKAASFGQGINVTLGLPFPRTSVDHGTALDLAQDPALAKTADVGSLIAAVELAIELARRAATAR